MKIEAIKEKARSHEQKEEWQKALELYLDAIRKLADDEDGQPDIGLYNRAGDLQTRIGNIEGAVDHYEEAIDLYLEADLPNNAIAICKKVLRNLPERADIYLKLGQIRANQGFLVDARQNFLTYAELKQNAGEMDEAFRALVEFADLAPDEVEIRLAVAQQMESSERVDEAVEQYVKAYQQYVRAGDPDQAAEIRGKILELKPDAEIPEPESLAPGKAAAPAGAMDLPGFATEDFSSEEEEEEEEAVGMEIEADLGDFEIGGDEEEEEAGEEDEEGAAGGELAMADSEEEDFGFDLDEEEDEEPEEPEEEAEPLPMMELDEEETLDDVAAGFDLGEEGEEEEGGFEEPEEEPEPLPMMELGEEEEEEAEEPEEEAEPLPMMDLGEEGEEEEEGFEEPEEEPEPLPMMDLGDEEAGAEEVSETGDEPEEEEEEEAVLTAAAFGEADHRDTRKEYVEEVEELPPLEVELDDLPEDEGESSGEAAEPGGGFEAMEAASGDEPSAAFEAVVEEEAPARRDHRALADEGDFEGAAALLREEIQDSPDDVALRQRLVEYAHRAGDPDLLVPAYLQLAECLERQGSDTKARAVYQQVLSVDPENRTALARLEGRDAEEEGGAPEEDVAVASTDEYVDLGAMIFDEESEKTTRWVVAAEEPSGDEEADFAAMLSQFKQKVAENVAQDDLHAHYDLGTAYKEMGLIEEAISEFQQALRADPRHLPTHELLGHCFLERGEYEVAVRSLTKATALPDTIEDDLIGIYYYLGRAHEGAGNTDSAREFYEKVFALDINFADVTERLRALR